MVGVSSKKLFLSRHMCVVAPLSTHHTSSLLVNFAQRVLTEDDVNVTISSAAAWVCSDAIETCFSFAIFVQQSAALWSCFGELCWSGGCIPSRGTADYEDQLMVRVEGCKEGVPATRVSRWVVGSSTGNVSRGGSGESVTDGLENMDCGAVQAVGRVVGAAGASAEERYKGRLNSEHPYAQVGAEIKASPEYFNRRYSLRMIVPSCEVSEILTGLDTVSQGRRICPNMRTSEEEEFPMQRIRTDPIPPPRTRRSISSLTLGSASLPGSAVDIPAATAIAGRVSANRELPYMTPPIENQHFSGDSQDSKGYTSISVREPLANIKAQTDSRLGGVDPPYATVSDDSEMGFLDEMYAAIEEPGRQHQVYTSDSETYAQIQPPSADSLKPVHSRQASSSSAASSVANLGSPKPEKRPANSPLPPPPPVEDSGPLLDLQGIPRSLEDMYAKVNKKKQQDDPIVVPATQGHSSSIDFQSQGAHTEADAASHSSSDLDVSQDSRVIEFDLSGSCSSPHTFQSYTADEPGYESLGDPQLSYHDPGYEVLHRLERHASDCDPNYEELRPQHNSNCARVGDLNRDMEPGYEKVQVSSLVDPDYSTVDGKLQVVDPNYEELRPQNGSDCASLGNPNRHLEPGYEKVQVSNLAESDYSTVDKKMLAVDPNYEELRPQHESDYASVGDPNRHIQPGYEKVQMSNLVEPDYSTVDRKLPVVEPDYEMVNHTEPNYASVYYSDLPPYERLNETRDSDNNCDSGNSQAL
uniref:Uncharacterized protein n=1 Tax=Timema shepardi TaxID=629360 RepID=A0A7R9AM36_TIMSH|nr:unnamed protein product [Timema shepardi]